MKKKFKTQVVMNAIDEGVCGGLKLVEQGKWKDEGKYQYQECILKDTNGNFWCYDLAKSGSYFTEFTFSWDWEGDTVELVQVREATKTIEYWETVE